MSASERTPLGGDTRPGVAISQLTGRRVTLETARLGGGSSFHFLSNVIAGTPRQPQALGPCA